MCYLCYKNAILISDFVYYNFVVTTKEALTAATSSIVLFPWRLNQEGSKKMQQKLANLNTKRTGNRFNRKDNITLSIMLIPAAVLFTLFSYLPMFGVVMAFKDYRYSDGIFGSPWVGLNNFKYVFLSNDVWILIRNTLGYNLVFILMGVITGVIVALALYEVKYKFMTKYLQTTFILPNFMSWVVVAYIFYAFLDPVYGFLNNALEMNISWYSTPKYWPFILLIAHVWKHVGMGSVMYYAALMAI